VSKVREVDQTLASQRDLQDFNGAQKIEGKCKLSDALSEAPKTMGVFL
jgi:hypothetical protein